MLQIAWKTRTARKNTLNNFLPFDFMLRLSSTELLVTCRDSARLGWKFNCCCLHQDVRAAVFEMMKNFNLEPLDLQNRPLSSTVALEILPDSANSTLWSSCSLSKCPPRQDELLICLYIYILYIITYVTYVTCQKLALAQRNALYIAPFSIQQGHRQRPTRAHLCWPWAARQTGQCCSAAVLD